MNVPASFLPAVLVDFMPGQTNVGRGVRPAICESLPQIALESVWEPPDNPRKSHNSKASGGANVVARRKLRIKMEGGTEDREGCRDTMGNQETTAIGPSEMSASYF
jgi:hypothetical protein